jgi:very-short-patch-repair endonuclease
VTIANARRLRRALTDAERKLWTALRSRRFDGYKFRRQHPFGPYVLDFYCEQRNLAIELDGGQHSEQVERDAVRTAWLAAQGCKVVRFWNNDVSANLPAVLEQIRGALTAG